MKRFSRLLLFFLLLISFVSNGQTPIEFIENKGQWGDWFQYRATTRGSDIFLERDGFRILLQDKSNNFRLDSFHHGQIHDNPLLKFHCYKLKFEGSNATKMVGKKRQSVYYNYFLGNDPTKWKAEIHPYYGLDYENLYKDIDLHVTSEHGNLVYEFMVKPEADVEKIKIGFEGQDKLKLDKAGNLLISTSVGDIKEVKPYVYQYINDEKVTVPCKYNLEGNQLSFIFPEGYDHKHAMVIDPTVVFCTLTGSTADNWGYSATYDDSGNFYAGGLVNVASTSEHFPVTTGAIQTRWGGGVTYISGSMVLAYAADISLIKYAPDGRSRIYGTYLGGAQNDHVHSMIVDHLGNLVLAGRTLSVDFPTTSGCYQSSNHGSWDMVVTSINSSGTALIGSTYVGGAGADVVNYDSTEYYYGDLKYNYGDDSRSEVQVDNSNNIYVAGCTMSTDFPTTSTAIATTLSGQQDGIVLKFNRTLNSMIWGTYLGGNNADAAYVLAFDSTQQYLYVAGGTKSSNFPSTSGSWLTSYQGGGADGFVTKFLNSGSYSIQKSTFVGTRGYDQVYGIQIYPTNDVYVMGQSIGGTFPVTSGVYSNPNSCQFIMKMDRDLTSDLISTVFGSGASTHSNISPVAFLVDTCSNVYVSGWGGNLGISGIASGNCTGMPVTSDAFQSTTDGNDFYFIVLGANMTTLRYATYHGRSCTLDGYGEHVDGGTSRFDKHGVIYQGICASCGGPAYGGTAPCRDRFPTTAYAWSEVDSSGNCNEGALKIAFSLGPVHIDISASPSDSGCAPYTVSFHNHTSNAVTFRWDFGDGSSSDTAFEPSHTFTTPGVYTVVLTAANSNACFVTDDTFRLVITVGGNLIDPSFTYSLLDSCGPYTASFTNTSTQNGSLDTTATFNWNFGDGTTFSGSTPPTHTFPDTGTYTIRLIMIEPNACNSPDTFTKTITIQHKEISGSFVIPDSVCIGTSISPQVGGDNILNYSWQFGDSVTFSVPIPSYTFPAAGTYTVTLIVTNPSTCNFADTFRAVIKVLAAPIADFTFVPLTPVENVPTRYTNLSVDATRYSWAFGDGSTSGEVNPTHQFSRSGTFHTCLTAYNGSNCPSTKCKEVPADVVPIIGIPDAFSPNNDGENDILYVHSAAIESFDLKIFNRWGELIFETTSKAVGWDGSFNGQPCPVDAYGYVLTAAFIDGTHKTLKGNITLLR